MNDLLAIKRYYNENVNSPRGGITFKNIDTKLSFYIFQEHRKNLFDKTDNLKHFVATGYRDYKGQKVIDYLLNFSDLLREAVKNRLSLETDEFLHPLTGYPIMHKNKLVLLPLLSREILFLDKDKHYDYYELIPRDLSLDNFRLLAGGVFKYSIINIGRIYVTAPVNMALYRLKSILISDKKHLIELPFNVILPEGWAVYDNMGYHFRTTKAGMIIQDIQQDRLWVLDNRIKSDSTILSYAKLDNTVRIVKTNGMYIVKGGINKILDDGYKDFY